MHYLADKAPVTRHYSAKQILKQIANRYMHANPFCGFCVKPSVDSGFRQGVDGLYRIDFSEKYPEAKLGDYAYAYTCIRSDVAQQVTVAANMMCGGEIWINGECVFKTTVQDEQAPCIRRQLINLQAGRNPVLIKARKTSLGFCVGFGEACIAWKPIYLHMPFAGYEEYLGFAWSGLFHEDIYKTPETFPDAALSAPAAFARDYLGNAASWDAGIVYAAAYFRTEAAEDVRLCVETSEETAVYIDGTCCGTGENSFRVEAALLQGEHYLVLETRHQQGKPYHFDVQGSCGHKELTLYASREVSYSGAWLVMGPLREENSRIQARFSLEDVGSTPDGQTYWRAGATQTYFRKLRIADNFGKWSYPLGVVLYGLLHTAAYLEDSAISQYVTDHLKQIVDNEDYAELDGLRFGVPSISRQLVCLGMLDYCGSCGNALLKAYRFAQDTAGYDRIADRVAGYISEKQERLENGMFFRNRVNSAIDCQTVWADDLYMSVPFLCSYYAKTGQRKYLDDAVWQILKFKELLYMPDRKLMSHVFNLNHKKKTMVPWGRGNGWVLFALTELLDVLDERHIYYRDILDFYLEFAQGIQSQQGESGLWHQVLDEHDSYSEISCTAMFVYAFAKGVMAGRLDPSYGEAALAGWNGICAHAVDADGNVYGVCCGSAYSFRSDYYKYELPWIINDTHGTGIVLLAGVEALRLAEKGNM